jgi:hypothetical protein
MRRGIRCLQDGNMSQPAGKCQLEKHRCPRKRREFFGAPQRSPVYGLHCYEIAAAARSNPSTTRLSRLGLKREQGPEMLIAETAQACASRMGAATQVASSVVSSRSKAKGGPASRALRACWVLEINLWRRRWLRGATWKPLDQVRRGAITSPQFPATRPQRAAWRRRE